MNANTCYKLTHADGSTRNGTQWTLGKWRTLSVVDVSAALCGPHWLHAYDDPYVGLFLNPIHAAINSPRIWLAEWAGERKDDLGRKFGATRLRVVREITNEIESPTTTQRVAFAVLCGLQVETRTAWREWAERWLSGEDRSANAALAAANANAYAAVNAAAYAACAAAAYDAAAYAAYAANAAANAACAACAAANAAVNAANAAANADFNLAEIAHWAMALGVA